MKRERASVTMLHLAEDLLFPRRCPICDRPVHPFGALICPECEERMTELSPERDVLCCRCGKPLSDPTAEYCGDCAGGGHEYLRGCAVYRYREVSGAIYRFKYEGRAEYADFFGMRMAQRLGEEFDPAKIDAMIPVPLSEERCQSRGYNQAGLLARRIGQETGIPVREDILLRGRGTQVLRSMSADARRANLKNAFIVSADDVKSKVYVLVDDIYTTGATMDACAGALRLAGAAGVFFITLAIGEDPFQRDSA